MNMEKIEAEIRMFDRMEIIFALGAAAAAAAILIIMIVHRMKRNDMKPGRRALILAAAVLAVTGVYTGTVVFAGEEGGSEEGEGLRLNINENAGAADEALLEITGNLTEDSFLKLTVSDEETAVEELTDTAKEEDTLCFEEPRDTAQERDTLYFEEPGDTAQEGDTLYFEEPRETVQEEDTLHFEEPRDTVQEEDTLHFKEPQDMAKEEDALYPEELPVPSEKRTAKEIEIGLFTDPQYTDAEALEYFLTEQAVSFDSAGLILKDAVIRTGFLRSLFFGLKETGNRWIKAGLINGRETHEVKIMLSRDETAAPGAEAGHDNDGTHDVSDDGIYPEYGAESGSNGNEYAGTVTDSGIQDAFPDSGNEIWQQTGGDVPEDHYGDITGGESEDPDSRAYEEISAEKPAADETDNSEDPDNEDKASEGEDGKNSADEEPPVIVIKPDDQGSGFEASEETKEAVNNVYISEAKEVRIIETNAEEIDAAEIVYTVNGETYPMEYGADYNIEKADTGEGWQYEYVVAPHVFEKDGYYNINITSKDSSGNVSNNKTAGLEVSFVVDRTSPSLIVTNLADGGVYGDGGHEYKVTIRDNTLLKYFRIYENKKLKAEYIYDREKWINMKDEADLLEAPGGTVTLKAEASGEVKTIEFEAEDESGNICRSSSYNIIVGRSRSSSVIPFAVTAASITFAAALAIKYYGSRKTAVRHNRRGSH